MLGCILCQVRFGGDKCYRDLGSVSCWCTVIPWTPQFFIALFIFSQFQQGRLVWHGLVILVWLVLFWEGMCHWQGAQRWCSGRAMQTWVDFTISDIFVALLRLTHELLLAITLRWFSFSLPTTSTTSEDWRFRCWTALVQTCVNKVCLDSHLSPYKCRNPCVCTLLLAYLLTPSVGALAPR